MSIVKTFNDIKTTWHKVIKVTSRAQLNIFRVSNINHVLNTYTLIVVDFSYCLYSNFSPSKLVHLRNV